MHSHMLAQLHVDEDLSAQCALSLYIVFVCLPEPRLFELGDRNIATIDKIKYVWIGCTGTAHTALVCVVE